MDLPAPGRVALKLTPLRSQDIDTLHPRGGSPRDEGQQQRVSTGSLLGITHWRRRNGLAREIPGLGRICGSIRGQEGLMYVRGDGATSRDQVICSPRLVLGWRWQAPCLAPAHYPGGGEARARSGGLRGDARGGEQPPLPSTWPARAGRLFSCSPGAGEGSVSLRLKGGSTKPGGLAGPAAWGLHRARYLTPSFGLGAIPGGLELAVVKGETHTDPAPHRGAALV